MDRAKVFVTQEVTTANYGPAEDWGDVTFLSASEVSNVTNSLHNVKLVQSIRDRLQGFNPETDYIAPSGSPVITGLVFAVIREKTTKFNVLKWNARDGAYSLIKIDIAGERRVY